MTFSQLFFSKGEVLDLFYIKHVSMFALPTVVLDQCLGTNKYHKINLKYLKIIKAIICNFRKSWTKPFCSSHPSLYLLCLYTQTFTYMLHVFTVSGKAEIRSVLMASPRATGARRRVQQEHAH